MLVPLQEKPTVILVDDDIALRTALRFSLELDGFAVQTFASGEDVLKAVLPHRDGCLVFDQNLPGITGVETLSILRSRAIHLPALLITSHPGVGVREAAARAQATIVEKPLLGDALVGSILRVLEEAKGQ